MLWVDAIQTRYMSFLGYVPMPSHWFIKDRNGQSVNGYTIAAGDIPRVEQILSNAGIYHHR